MHNQMGQCVKGWHTAVTDPVTLDTEWPEEEEEEEQAG